MQKIKSITFRNFKFFFGEERKHPQNKLELNENNLLLFGENGSGKSSIYWGLYTFLQSSLKSDDQIKKYFEPANPENLRNRFATDTDGSGIIIELIDSRGLVTKEISDSRRDTTADSTVLKINAGSDFLNYKYLSKLYDFRNSQEIDLFDWFERELLMFIDFEEGYRDHLDLLSSSTLASDWWTFIREGYKDLPKNLRQIHTVNERSDEYFRYKQITIPRFNRLLRSFLDKIATKANEYLSNEFDEEIEIDFGVSTISCEYNKSTGQRAKDGILHRPKIPLKVKFNHNKLNVLSKEVKKPHTFLNEAKLTAIALAMRLAMLDERPVLPDAARFLILDDLLLSLDMSHRDKVLDIILNLTVDYQLLILTHDRAFYNLCKNRIENRFSKGWEFREMYQSENKQKIPCPFIPDKKSYLDLAKKYLLEFDYPACANYLRKEGERLICYILPQNLWYKDDLDSGSTKLMLDGLISKLKAYFNLIGVDYTPFEKLKEYKDTLMNPLSHDNLDSPIYKQELLNALELIEKLNDVKIKTIGIVDPTNTNPFTLEESDDSGDLWQYTFYLKENFRAIKDLSGNWFISNPQCFFEKRKNLSQSTSDDPIINEYKLKEAYNHIHHKLGLKTAGKVPSDLRIIIKQGVTPII